MDNVAKEFADHVTDVYIQEDGLADEAAEDILPDLAITTGGNPDDARSGSPEAAVLIVAAGLERAGDAAFERIDLPGGRNKVGRLLVHNTVEVTLQHAGVKLGTDVQIKEAFFDRFIERADHKKKKPEWQGLHLPLGSTHGFRRLISAGADATLASQMPRRNRAIQERLTTVGTAFALLWLVEIIDLLLLGGRLDAYGIRPREAPGLWGIPIAPFLHGNFAHLAANSGPFLLLGWFVALRGARDFIELSVLVTLLGGFGTWLIGKSGTTHIGASIVIFGYFGFLITRGLIEFSLPSLLVALIVGVLYGGLIWGVLPSQNGISWEGHLCGMLAGVFCAKIAPKRRGL